MGILLIEVIITVVMGLAGRKDGKKKFINCKKKERKKECSSREHRSFTCSKRSINI